MSTSRTPAPDNVLCVRDESGGKREFMYAEHVADLKAALTGRLAKLKSGETLHVDFSNVGMSSDAAREFLKRALVQVRQGGTLAGRGIVLRGLGRGTYNVKVMLESEDLTAVIEDERGRLTLLGDAEQAAIETFDYLAKREWALARDVKEHFNLKSVAAATNRLARLADLGVVRRVGQESAEGGGLQYRYAAVR